MLSIQYAGLLDTIRYIWQMKESLLLPARLNPLKKIIESFNGEAKVIGKANKSDDPKLLLETEFGGIRRVGMLETMQLPRIC